MTGPGTGALLPLPTPTAFMLSIVVPVYNEEASLPTMHQRLSEVIAGIDGSVEIVFVDDGSKDRSAQLLQEIHARDPRVSVVRFSRNFGKEPAVSAGLYAARGEAVIVMDGDLQHPPEMLPAMVDAWRAGADVVNMRRRSRADESWIKRQAAGSFYSMINKLSDIPIPADVGDFRLFSRRAVDALNRMPERNRFMKGLFAWIGFDQVTLDYDVGARLAAMGMTLEDVRATLTNITVDSPKGSIDGPPRGRAGESARHPTGRGGRRVKDDAVIARSP